MYLGRIFFKLNLRVRINQNIRLLEIVGYGEVEFNQGDR